MTRRWTKYFFFFQIYLHCNKGKDEVSMLVGAKTSGATPLVIACRNGHYDVAEYLIEKCQADLEQPGSGNSFSFCVDCYLCSSLKFPWSTRSKHFHVLMFVGFWWTQVETLREGDRPPFVSASESKWQIANYFCLQKTRSPLCCSFWTYLQNELR